MRFAKLLNAQTSPQRLGLIVLTLSASLSACSGQSFPGSQLFDNVASRPNAPAPLKALKPVSNSINARKIWQIKTGGANPFGSTQPFINAQHIVVAGNQQLSAWNKNSGKAQWKTNIGEIISAGVNGSQGQLFIGTSNGNAVAIDATNGKTLWVERLNSEILSVSRAQDNRVVFRTIDGKLHALTSGTGELVWEQSQRTPALTQKGAGVPIIVGKYVISGFDNGKIAAYALANGKQAWEVTLAEPNGQSELERMVDIDGKLKVLGTALFANSLNGTVSGVDLLKGKAVWAKFFSSSTGVDADSKGLYSSDSKGNIWKFSPQTGQPMWKMDDLARRQPTTPVIVKPGLLLVADKQGNLHWINATNGQFVARMKGDQSGYNTAPIVQDNAVYVFSKNGVLTKLGF